MSNRIARHNKSLCKEDFDSATKNQDDEKIVKTVFFDGDAYEKELENSKKYWEEVTGVKQIIL